MYSICCFENYDYCTTTVHLLEGWLIPRLSVVDRHRVEADPDPDPTFHFDADPYPDLDPTPSFKQIVFIFSYNSTGTRLHYTIILIGVKCVLIFNILKSVLNF